VGDTFDTAKTCSETDEPLLTVSDLSVVFETDLGSVRAVDGVSFVVNSGEILGLVGESGCGKSVTCYSILRLLQLPPARYSGGSVRFNGANLLDLDEKQMRRVRGNTISMIFQEPMSSLNPIMRIGSQITEAIREHREVSRIEAKTLAIDMLRRVGIAGAEERFGDYPHQLSGGMKQRAMIAMALVCKPLLLVADEPTTALDVTIQAQILALLRDLQQELRMSILLITHDLGVVAETCDRVAVMYAGKIVETASASDLFELPLHPYTRGLFNSLPAMSNGNRRLPVIPGSVPNPLRYPEGCRFHPRCEFARELCSEQPLLREVTPGRFAACHFSEEISLGARQTG
jgi:peptide/nickel transport system ATP-binding protein